VIALPGFFSGRRKGWTLRIDNVQWLTGKRRLVGIYMKMLTFAAHFRNIKQDNE
jgi:hypothetical protein